MRKRLGNTKIVEILVGIFMLLAFVSLLMLLIKVSGLSQLESSGAYAVTANFNNIGGLKSRAPVMIAGVTIGRVTKIVLDKNTFEAKVTIAINEADDTIPADSSASILTQGLLGSNYISINPGFAEKFLTNGSVITTTHSALILENLIGQFIFSLKK